MSGTLFDQPPAVPEHRVVALAGVLAGFRWPGRESFAKLSKKQQAAASRIARSALERLAEEDD